MRKSAGKRPRDPTGRDEGGGYGGKPQQKYWSERKVGPRGGGHRTTEGPAEVTREQALTHTPWHLQRIGTDCRDQMPGASRYVHINVRQRTGAKTRGSERTRINQTERQKDLNDLPFPASKCHTMPPHLPEQAAQNTRTQMRRPPKGQRTREEGDRGG